MPTPDALQIALTFSTLLVIWVGWAKYLGPRVRVRWDRVVGFFQAIAGRDPIVEKSSGREISPAVPPLGERLASIDDTMLKLVKVIESNQDAHHRIDVVTTDVRGLRVDVDALQAGAGERTAIRLESAALLDAVAKRDSDVIDPQETP